VGGTLTFLKRACNKAAAMAGDGIAESKPAGSTGSADGVRELLQAVRKEQARIRVNMDSRVQVQFLVCAQSRYVWDAHSSAQDINVFNLKGTPGSHIPLQASVDRLANEHATMRRHGIGAPLPIIAMSEFSPPWANEVVAFVLFCQVCQLFLRVIARVRLSVKAGSQSEVWQRRT
jgi:hypothetical protein